MNKVIILRGLPGSGKSTWVNNNVNDKSVVCSADDFWMKDGEYNFNPKLLGKAHQECKFKYTRLLETDLGNNKLVAVVDNTNTSAKEIKFYLNMAEELDIDIEIILFSCTVETSAKRNIHNVPLAILEKMNNKLKNSLPTRWPLQTCINTED